ncbi:MAG: cold-shock protein [Planctomycetes bacterium RBG_16_43_13]|nr:MAG: cold-shock protein [Planctomycetes bacterium RBG_16_43_13]
MVVGTVKWFNDQKGYGFIQMDGSSEDLFVHYSAVKMDGFKTLAAGDKVEFEVQKDGKGSKAINVAKAS